MEFTTSDDIVSSATTIDLQILGAIQTIRGPPAVSKTVSSKFCVGGQSPRSWATGIGIKICGVSDS
ncbi:MAG: hypothetical protein QXF79_03250 [Ignisphaera sp.]